MGHSQTALASFWLFSTTYLPPLLWQLNVFLERPPNLLYFLYRDLEGNSYLDPVFNETVQIVEFDEGFDTEVFFMYVTLAAAVILLLFLVYTFLPGITYFWIT